MRKPRILFEPEVISRTRVRQGEYIRRIALPLPDGLGQVLPRMRQVPLLRVLADNERQSDLRQMLKKLPSPGLLAFWPWWEIARLTRTRIAEPHWQNGDPCCIVKYLS